VIDLSQETVLSLDPGRFDSIVLSHEGSIAGGLTGKSYQIFDVGQKKAIASIGGKTDEWGYRAGPGAISGDGNIAVLHGSAGNGFFNKETETFLVYDRRSGTLERSFQVPPTDVRPESLALDDTGDHLIVGSGRNSASQAEVYSLQDGRRIWRHPMPTLEKPTVEMATVGPQDDANTFWIWTWGSQAPAFFKIDGDKVERTGEEKWRRIHQKPCWVMSVDPQSGAWSPSTRKT